MKPGKFIQHGSGSLSKSQRKAEKAARRSQKRAEFRAAYDIELRAAYRREELR